MVLFKDSARVSSPSFVELLIYCVLNSCCSSKPINIAGFVVALYLIWAKSLYCAELIF